MVRISFVRLEREHDLARRDEASKVVDVAAGVVADDTLRDPEDLVGAEVVAQNLLAQGAAELGVPRLIAREQALFRREERPLAVDVDGAAFEHEAVRLLPEGDHGLEQG